MFKKLFILLSIFFFSISSVIAVNDVAINSTGNYTLTNITSPTFSELSGSPYNSNLTISTGLVGLTNIVASFNSRTNYTGAFFTARILRDGVVINTYNVTSISSPISSSFVTTTTETEGTHKYALEVSVTNGFKAQIYGWKLSVFYLNTGSYSNSTFSGTTDNVVEGATNQYFTDIRAINATQLIFDVVNSTKLNISNLNSTVDKNLSNYTNTPNFITNETMSSDNNKWNKTDSISEVNLTLNYPTHSESHTLNGSEHTGQLDILRIFGLDTFNVTENTNLYFTNERVTNIVQPIFDSVNSTKLNITDYYNASGKTTLNEVNSSAQINISQVIGLQEQQDEQNSSSSNYNLTYANTTDTVNSNLINWNATYNITYDNTTNTIMNNLVNWNSTYNTTYDTKESTISTGNIDYFWNGSKVFVQLVSSYISDFTASVQAVIDIGGYVTNSTIDRNLSNYTNTPGFITSMYNSSYNTLLTNAPNTTVNNVNRTNFALQYVFDNSGTAIPINSSFWLQLPFYATITEIHVSSDLSSSTTFNITKSTPTGTEVQTFSDITGGNQVVMTTSGYKTDSTLTGWTLNISKDEMIKVNISVNNNATKILFTINGVKI